MARTKIPRKLSLPKAVRLLEPKMIGLIDDISLHKLLDPYIGFKTHRTLDEKASLVYADIAGLPLHQLGEKLLERLTSFSLNTFYDMVRAVFIIIDQQYLS